MTYPGFASALRDWVPALVATTLAMSGTAFADDTTPPAAPPAEQNSAWVKVCGTDQNKQQVCNVSQILLSPTGSVIASLSLQPGSDKKVAVGVFVPLGFVIPAGVTLAIDGDKKAVAQFTICVPGSPGAPGAPDQPAGCVARADLTDDFVALLRKGTKVSLVLADAQGQPIPIDMTLDGFGKAYDGDGLDPVAARAAEVSQSKQLQDDARAAFQRLMDKQKQGGAAAPAPTK